MTPSGPDSPLAAIELTILKLILAMADIREPLQPSRCIQVINDLIKDTSSQAKLIDFKNRMNTPIDSTPIQFIGPGYWQSYRKRFSHKLVNKKGHKFELDRSNWCTYQNFRSMYEMIEDKLVEVKIAKRFDSPMWITREGTWLSDTNINDAYGCKVSLEITHPGMVILADEVGCNISQRGDGHVGGEKYMCAKGKIPKKWQQKKSNTLPCLGLPF